MTHSIKDIAEEISVLMPVIARRILLQFFQSVHITQTQIFTITILFEQAPCRLSELSKKMNISAPTVTGIIDRLERLSYVQRIPDQNDRRAINVRLTKKGVKIAKKLRFTLKEKWQDLLSKLPPDDRENYLKILRKIQKNL